MSDRRALPLLLHSLTEVTEQVRGALEIVRPARIVEIGSESGGMTELLAAWAVEHGATVVSIDPDPAAYLRRLERESAALEIVAGASPAALDGIDGDVWFIDGDHNYATVTAELRHVFAAGTPPRLAVMHDVAWPCGRRDAYYAPERIAEHERHPYVSRGGVVPGEPGTVASGFSGRGQFFWAEREGGPRNGVLTAIEDTIAELGGLTFDVIPCLFGIGFLYSADASWAGALGAHLAPWSSSTLLDTLERNRVALYVRVLELQDALEAERADRDRLVAALHEQIARMEADALARRVDAATSHVESTILRTAH